MKLTFLGTGTSHGIPVIACDCKVCRSKNKKDKRNRCSAYVVTKDNHYILIDIGPEFRIQALKYKIKKISEVLLTHSHADHLHGIDDLRIFSCEMFKKPEDPNGLEKFNAPPIPIYTNKNTLEDIKVRFSYFFNSVKEGGGHARVELKLADSSFKIGETLVTPIPMMHGHLETVGWLLTEAATENGAVIGEAGASNCGKNSTKSIAYLTDCSYISEESIALIKKNCGRLVHLVIDGLRIKEHSTHFNYLQAMAAAEKIGAEHVWFTHMTHNSSHREYKAYVKEHLHEFPGLASCKSVGPAWDGLVIECNGEGD
ncbi:MAG: MBL fold metallo-hydrolase [Treponema sp.]|nr:MBL fold metallo-hydrolase [Treponema sp.]